MPLREVLQITFGALLPPILALHILGARYLHEFHGVNDVYGFVLINLWVLKPEVGALQALTLTLAWAHGSMGLFSGFV